MCELSAEDIQHQDLAARNVLVCSLDPVHVKVWLKKGGMGRMYVLNVTGADVQPPRRCRGGGVYNEHPP